MSAEENLVREAVRAWWKAAAPGQMADFTAAFDAAWSKVAPGRGTDLLPASSRQGLPMDASSGVLLLTVVTAALSLAREALLATTLADLKQRLGRIERKLWDEVGPEVADIRRQVEQLAGARLLAPSPRPDREDRPDRADRPGADRPGVDRPGLDRPGADRLDRPDRADRPDLVWWVRAEPAADCLRYEISAEDPSLALDATPYASPTFDSPPADYFLQVQKDIDEVLRGGGGHSQRDLAPARRGGALSPAATRRLANIGASLSQQLLPGDLHELLGAAARGGTRSLWIRSQEPWIPWELLALRGGDGEAPRFLCEMFDLCCWPIPGPHPPRIHAERRLPLRRVALVQPRDANLPALRKERQELGDLLGDRLRLVPAVYPDLLDELAGDGFDAWHFSGHGVARGTQPDSWGLVLEDGLALTPHDLRAISGTLQSKPLVVLNACHGGRRARSLTGLGGLAPQFLEAGAGAVIGAQFSINDRQAAAFAAAFYRLLLGGAPVGEALRKSRLDLRRDFGDDPSWLSLTAFAHPLARWDPP